MVNDVAGFCLCSLISLVPFSLVYISYVGSKFYDYPKYRGPKIELIALARYIEGNQEKWHTEAGISIYKLSGYF